MAWAIVEYVQVHEEADDQEGLYEDTPRPRYRTTKVVGMVISPESDELHAGPEDPLVRGRPDTGVLTCQH